MPDSTGFPIAAVRRAPTTLEEAVEVVRGSDPGAWTILITTRRHHRELRRLVYQARAATEESRIAFHISDLSPLGAAALEEMAQPLIGGLAPHDFPSSLLALESQIRCLAIMDSVRSLRAPAPSILLHARSWLPGGTYLAELGRRARLLNPRVLEQHVPPADPGVIAILGPGGAQGPRGQRVASGVQTLLDHLAPHDVLPRDNADPEWWGSERTAQIVLAPQDLGAALERGSREIQQTTPATLPSRELARPPQPQEANR